MTKEKQDKLDQFFMKTAINASEFSHCVRLKVGCVITKNNRIISTGYNGTPESFYNCDDVNAKLDLTSQEDKIKHHSFSEKYEIHAEMNAIIDMAKRQESPVDSTVYITTAPCHNCAKLLIAAGVRRVVYLEAYDLETIKNATLSDDDIWYGELSGIDILKLAQIKVDQVNVN
jgi:dCMP deaminase